MASDQSGLVDPVRAYLGRHFTQEKLHTLAEAHGEDAVLWEEVADEGWFSLVSPESQGGIGVDPVDLSQIFRVIGERLLGGAILEQMLLPGALLRSVPGGSSGIVDRLGRAASGQVRLGYANPAAFSALDFPAPDLVMDAGTLSGSVELVRFGHEIDEILVPIKTGSGWALVLIDAARSGVMRTRHSSTDPGSTFARLQFNQVTVTEADHVVASATAASLHADLQSWHRLLIASELAGIARHLLDTSVAYVKVREQFDRAVGSFQAVKHLAAASAQRVILLENFCEAVVADAPRQSSVDFGLATAALKANASEMAVLVCQDALQMHGGIGFTYEHEIHWYYKRALSLRSWYGDEQTLAVDLGRAVIEGCGVRD